MRLKQESFNAILEKNFPEIELTPTNLRPNPTSTHLQLVLTIYRLATGCTFSTLEDYFGVSFASASIFS